MNEQDKKELKEFLKKEWPGIHRLIWSPEQKVEVIPKKTRLEDLISTVETERMNRDSLEMRTVYEKWFEKFSLVRTNFDELSSTIDSFVKQVPNWARYPRGHSMTVSGNGYSFDTGVETHRRGLRLYFPDVGHPCGLGDERQMGLYGLLRSGPTENPYGLFNGTGTTPDLKTMLNGSKRLLELFQQERFFVSAYATQNRFSFNISSDKLVTFLQDYTLKDLFNRLMVAINADDLAGLMRGQSQTQINLPLLVSGMGS